MHRAGLARSGRFAPRQSHPAWLPVGVALALLSPERPVSAEPWALLGARYQGMGGAGVATVDDAHAVYWNPAALAYAEGWSLMLPFSVQASAEGDAIETLDLVIGIGDTVRPIKSKVRKGRPLTQDDVVSLLSLARGIADIDPDGEGLLIDSELGFRGNVGQVGLASVALVSAAVQPAKDEFDLQMSVDDLGPVQQVLNVVGDGANHSAGSAEPFAQPRSQALADHIARDNAAFSQDQAEEFVYRAEAARFRMDDREHRQFVKRSARETASAGDRDIGLNETGGFVRGILMTEVGVGYGRVFEIPHVPGEIALGMVPKLIVGTTFFDFIRWDEVSSFADAVDRLLSGPTVRTSANFGLDLGFLARPVPGLSLGLTARNVNKPSFQFAGNGRYTIDPQVRAGVAYWITERWLAAFDVDVTKNNTESITRFESRQVSFGTEYRVPWERLELALRTGLWTNVADKANDAVAWTFGFSVGKGGFWLDLAGGTSFAMAEIEDVTFPERANFALNLRYEKRF